MRRAMGTAAFGLSLAALALGPWLALAGMRSTANPDPSPWFFPVGLTADAPPMPTSPRVRSACNCRTVDVNLHNDVSDVEVRTGDATVINFTVTYVTAGYGEREVDVDQEAIAISGDAVAGQVINVDARGPRCVNVRVHASNRVVDSEVSSGAATAINHSIVLVDPAMRRGDLEIDVEQEAEAHSGEAIAGQVIGLVGGNRVGGCGGRVDLKAVNEVFDTDVTTGRATFRNVSVIRTCETSGCLSELRALIGPLAQLRVCSGSTCRDMNAAELAAMLSGEEERSDPEGETHDVVKGDRCAAGPSPSATPAAATAEPSTDRASPAPAPSAEPASTGAPSATKATTSSAPAGSPAPCPTATPVAEPAPELIATGPQPSAEPTAEHGA